MCGCARVHNSARLNDNIVDHVGILSDILCMKEIAFTAAAAKQLDALPSQAGAAIFEALCVLAISGRGDVKALQGRDGYRLRVGQYRVIFDADAVTILAIEIGRRTTTTY